MSERTAATRTRSWRQRRSPAHDRLLTVSEFVHFVIEAGMPSDVFEKYLMSAAMRPAIVAVAWEGKTELFFEPWACPLLLLAEEVAIRLYKGELTKDEARENFDAIVKLLPALWRRSIKPGATNIYSAAIRWYDGSKPDLPLTFMKKAIVARDRVQALRQQPKPAA